MFQNGSIRIKFYDKVQALERLMRFLGMFEKDNAQQRRSLLDDLSREELKEIEKALIEITRARGVEPPSDGGGGLPH